MVESLDQFVYSNDGGPRREHDGRRARLDPCPIHGHHGVVAARIFTGALSSLVLAAASSMPATGPTVSSTPGNTRRMSRSQPCKTRATSATIGLFGLREGLLLLKDLLERPWIGNLDPAKRLEIEEVAVSRNAVIHRSCDRSCEEVVVIGVGPDCRNGLLEIDDLCEIADGFDPPLYLRRIHVEFLRIRQQRLADLGERRE